MTDDVTRQLQLDAENTLNAACYDVLRHADKPVQKVIEMLTNAAVSELLATPSSDTEKLQFMHIRANMGGELMATFVSRAEAHLALINSKDNDQ